MAKPDCVIRYHTRHESDLHDRLLVPRATWVAVLKLIEDGSADDPVRVFPDRDARRIARSLRRALSQPAPAPGGGRFDQFLVKPTGPVGPHALLKSKENQEVVSRILMMLESGRGVTSEFSFEMFCKRG